MKNASRETGQPANRVCSIFVVFQQQLMFPDGNVLDSRAVPRGPKNNKDATTYTVRHFPLDR